MLLILRKHLKINKKQINSQEGEIFNIALVKAIIARESFHTIKK